MGEATEMKRWKGTEVEKYNMEEATFQEKVGKKVEKQSVE